MTRIEKVICLIVGIIIAVSTVVVLTISIVLSSSQSEKAYEDMVNTGINVLNSNIVKKEKELMDTYAAWEADGKVASAIKKGFVGTLAETFDKFNVSPEISCLFTDDKGKKMWASENYKLSTYDVSAVLEGSTISGIVADSGVPLCYVYMTPVLYYQGATESRLMVGTCILCFDLTATGLVDDVKSQIGSEVMLFSGDTVCSTTFADAEGARDLTVVLDENIRSKVIEGGEDFSGKRNIGGTNYYVRYSPLYDMNGNICGALFAGNDSTSSDASSRNIIINSVIAAILILAISFAILVFFMKKIIAKPIVEVSALADSMNRGQLNVPDFTYKFANNELGEFALSLQSTKHSLASYISDISNILDSMASGDFTVKPSIEYTGDFERIARSFEQIREQLSGIVRSINDSSEQVLNGSAHMANGSQILASGTTTQANAIDNLNTTIIAISDKTQVNAQHARKAKQLSAGVESSAVEQNRQMQGVMDAMTAIEKRSSEIGNIIKTIDDIAFQTNILALNAAVEAARAGDAGKGFAVVADEVRNLATKSAEAAQETTNLISATISAVSNGTELVQSAADSMKEITEKAKETYRLIDEIAAASDTQADAIKEVTVGLEQISDVVAQNSATAEQSAASCEELSSQSRLLRSQIDKLKA